MKPDVTSMNEELLTRALDSAAGRIRAESLRPLTEPRQRVRPGWLAPVAAAAAMVLVAVLVVAVSSWNQARLAGDGGARGGQPAALPNGLPAYYAAVETTSHGSGVVVRSTATGNVIARIAGLAIPGQTGLYPISVTAAPDDQTFYALYSNDTSGPGGGMNSNSPNGQLIAGTFRILPSGGATTPEEVKGGVITGQSGVVNPGGIAVSPDGSRLAVGVSDPAISSGPVAAAGEILVIDLRTGAHATWAGGMNRPGQPFYLAGLSWTGDGRSLVYLAQWCPAAEIGNSVGGAFCTVVNGNGAPPRTDSQVREIGVTSDGGTLNSGPVLLRRSARYPYIAQALIDPGGRDIIAVVQQGRYVEVVKIAVATGETVSVLYRQRYSELPSLDSYRLVADRGHLLYAEGNGASVSTHGWIQDGRLHELAPILRVPDPRVAYLDPTW